MILVLIPVLLESGSIYAQETKVVKDFRVWTGVKVEKKLGKSWEVSLEEEMRFQKDASEIASYFTQAGIDYRINRNFTIDGRYRFIQNQKKDGSFETRSRYNLDLKYKTSFYFISVHARLRYQKEVESMDLLNNRIPYEKYMRYRAEIRYELMKDLTPFVSAELFQAHRLHDYPDLEQVRFAGGIVYEPGRFGKIEACYMLDRELAVFLPYSYYTFSLNYSYTF